MEPGDCVCDESIRGVVIPVLHFAVQLERSRFQIHPHSTAQGSGSRAAGGWGGAGGAAGRAGLSARRWGLPLLLVNPIQSAPLPLFREGRRYPVC